MITRTAIFEGRVKSGCEERFFSEINARLAPLWRKFPHATNVRLLRIVDSDPGAQPVAMIQQIDYPSMAALEEAIGSPVRAQARAITLELMEMFEGRFYHLLSERNVLEHGA
jgi:hypothetical protein